MFIPILFSTALLLMVCSGDAEQNTNDDKIKGNQATEDQDNLEVKNDLNDEKDEK